MFLRLALGPFDLLHPALEHFDLLRLASETFDLLHPVPSHLLHLALVLSQFYAACLPQEIESKCPPLSDPSNSQPTP